VHFVTAPGRVEVLGNHLDYNGGPVLAAAIDRRTMVVAEENRSDAVELEVVFADVDHSRPAILKPADLADWRNATDSQTPSDFAKGVIAALLARHLPIRCSRFAVASSVPIGVGVSSSAALCVAITLALCETVLEEQNLVIIAQEAEHRAGTPCGTMDQSTSVAGGMIRFEGADLSTRELELDLKGHAFLVIDSGVRRSLVNSSYSRRVQECRHALTAINEILGTRYPDLASVRQKDLDRAAQAGSGRLEPVLLRRAQHVVSEVSRVNEGENALARSDWRQFGQLMTESGRSSAMNYEISHPVVEELVLQLIDIPGVLGARMMGGGEGGSMLALIEPDSGGNIRALAGAAVNQERREVSPLLPVYEMRVAEGATRGRIADMSMYAEG
jgi:galactokinase